MSLYIPIKSEEFGSTYLQQYRFFKEKDTELPEPDPVAKFWSDLSTILSDWYEKGYTLIIGGDFNQDIRNPKLREFF